jgi:hypothetical protein
MNSAGNTEAATPAPVTTPAQTVASAPAVDSVASTTLPPVDTTTNGPKTTSTKGTGPKAPAKPSAKEKAANLPSVASLPGPVASAVPREDERFKPSVERLIDAIRDKDVQALEAAFPEITPNQRRFFTDLFDRAKTAQLTVTPVRGPAPRISDSHATGPITLAIEYHDPTTLARVGPNLYQYDATWEERADNQWYLISLKSKSP